MLHFHKWVPTTQLDTQKIMRKISNWWIIIEQKWLVSDIFRNQIISFPFKQHVINDTNCVGYFDPNDKKIKAYAIKHYW